MSKNDFLSGVRPTSVNGLLSKTISVNSSNYNDSSSYYTINNTQINLSDYDINVSNLIYCIVKVNINVSYSNYSSMRAYLYYKIFSTTPSAPNHTESVTIQATSNDSASINYITDSFDTEFPSNGIIPNIVIYSSNLNLTIRDLNGGYDLVIFYN